jgi:hypothetical protein
MLGCGGERPEAESVGAAPAPAPSPAASEAPPAPAPTPSPVGEVAVTIVPVVPDGVAGRDTAREYTRMFYAGELEPLFEKFSPEMRTEILPLEKLRALREQVRERYGEETQVLGEDSQTKGDLRGFARWARFSRHDGVIEIRWILRPDDTVAGFMVIPAKLPQRK